MPQKLGGFGCVLIMNGKYVIIWGGCKAFVPRNIPMDVLKKIDMYIECERLHLFFAGHTVHYVIDVSDIMLNCW